MESVGWALLHFLWQGALIAIICKLGLALLKKSSPHVRYVFAFSILMLMLGVTAGTAITLYSSSAAISGVSPGVVGSSTGGIQTAAIEAVHLVESIYATTAILDISKIEASLSPIVPWFVGLWFIGVLLLSIQLFAGLIIVHKTRTEETSAAPQRIVESVSRLSSKLGIDRGIKVLESKKILVPTVIGWLKPVILLPGSVITGLAQEQLEAIIAHELAHIRRHDCIFNFLQSFVEVVLFFHPAMWWVSAQVRTEREHCCDDAAVAVCGDVKVYVDALAELENIKQLAPQLALAATGGSLLDRVKRLARHKGAFKSQVGFQWIAIIILFSMLFVSLSYAQFSPFVGNGTTDKIFWTERDRDEIRMADLDGTNVETLFEVNGRPLGIALDRPNSKVYWTDERGRIQRASLDGSGEAELLVSNFDPILSIALDLDARQMYWAARSSIWRADMDGTNETLLVDRLRAPSSLQLDAENGQMYWTDMVSGSISRAELSGHTVEVLIEGRNQPISLALDQIHGRIYWTEDMSIFRSKLDGSELESVVSGPGAPVGLTLDLENDLIYWTDRDHGVLRRSNLDGSQVADLFIGLKNPISSVLK